MLALIFRGFVFLGVISWYSTSLWKTIDGIFKDQFQRYLDEEYKRNPRMREHLETIAKVDKPGNRLADVLAMPETAERLLEACNAGLDTCSVDEAVAAIHMRQQDESMPVNYFEVTTAPDVAEADVVRVEEKEKEVGRPISNTLEELLAFQDTTRWINGDAEPPDEREQPPAIESIYEEDEELIIEQDINVQTGIDKLQEQAKLLDQVSDVSYEDFEKHFKVTEKQQSDQQSNNQSQLDLKESSEQVKTSPPSPLQRDPPKQLNRPNPKKRESRRTALIGAKSEKVTKHRKKIQMLTLTPEDFATINRKRRIIYKDEEDYEEYDRDFSEFDDEDEEEVLEDEIAVIELPYKPAIDIYDLERLSAEEFCPLSLNDDLSCDETRDWSLN